MVFNMVLCQARDILATALAKIPQNSLALRPKFSVFAPRVARCALFGANWNNGTNAGVFCWNLNNAASNSNANISGHLTSLKNYCERNSNDPQDRDLAHMAK